MAPTAKLLVAVTVRGDEAISAFLRKKIWRIWKRFGRSTQIPLKKFLKGFKLAMKRRVRIPTNNLNREPQRILS